MKKTPLLFILGLIAINVLSNSCKKDNLSNIPNLLTSGTWQLATIQAYNYVGDSQISVETLDSTCTKTQFFTFKTDNTCSYTNFQCNSDTASGNWSLSQNRLIINSDMVCKDTTAASGGKSQPFANTEIFNLGNYSMVLLTGDIEPNYSATKKRRVLRYGFIRQKAVTQ